MRCLPVGGLMDNQQPTSVLCKVTHSVIAETSTAASLGATLQKECETSRPANTATSVARRALCAHNCSRTHCEAIQYVYIASCGVDKQRQNRHHLRLCWPRQQQQKGRRSIWGLFLADLVAEAGVVAHRSVAVALVVQHVVAGAPAFVAELKCHVGGAPRGAILEAKLGTQRNKEGHNTYVRSI